MHSTLHFSITGEFLNNFIHDMIEQEKYTKAYQLIQESLQIPTSESEADAAARCIKLMLGYSQLKTENDGTISIQNTNNDKNIDDCILELLSVIDKKNTQIQDLEQQVQHLSLQRNYLLCRMQDDRPYTLHEYLNDFKEEWDKPFLSDEESKEMGIKITNNYSVQSNLVSEFIERQVSNYDDDYGWLSPYGDFYPVEWGEHNKWAFEYLKKHYQYDSLCTTLETDRLCEKGWCLIHNPAQGIGKPTFLKPLTEKQKDFLYEYYNKRNKPMLIRQYCM